MYSTANNESKKINILNQIKLKYQEKAKNKLNYQRKIKQLNKKLADCRDKLKFYEEKRDQFKWSSSVDNDIIKIENIYLDNPSDENNDDKNKPDITKLLNNHRPDNKSLLEHKLNNKSKRQKRKIPNVTTVKGKFKVYN